jgi:predicted RecB family endonuclease
MVDRTLDDELANARANGRWNDVARILSQRIDSEDGAAKREHLRELIDIWENKFSNVRMALEARGRLAEVEPDDLANVEVMVRHLRARRDWVKLVTALDHIASRVDRARQAPLLEEMELVCRDRLGDANKADAIAARRLGGA